MEAEWKLRAAAPGDPGARELHAGVTPLRGGEAFRLSRTDGGPSTGRRTSPPAGDCGLDDTSYGTTLPDWVVLMMTGVGAAACAPAPVPA
jgi:hypothetical protein